MEKIFDTHAHYTDTAFDTDRDELIASLPKKNVGLIMQACTDLDDALKIQALSDKYDFMYASVGIHPENIANGVPDNAYDKLLKIAKHNKVLAIGEIGLDYHYEGYDRHIQIELFKMQLELAKELSLPVIVHSRDATEDCLNILYKYKPKGVMHCFSGSAETAKIIADLGMYIGFTGVLTFKNAKKALRAIEVVPQDKLVLETDCPYMAPVPYRGKRCDSSMIIHTAGAAATVLGKSTDEILSQTFDNGLRLFNIDLKRKDA